MKDLFANSDQIMDISACTNYIFIIDKTSKNSTPDHFQMQLQRHQRSSAVNVVIACWWYIFPTKCKDPKIIVTRHDTMTSSFLFCWRIEQMGIRQVKTYFQYWDGRLSLTLKAGYFKSDASYCLKQISPWSVFQVVYICEHRQCDIALFLSSNSVIENLWKFWHEKVHWYF